MIRATCIDCGGPFLREIEEAWKVRCLSCWAINKAKRGPRPAPRTAHDPIRDELGDRIRELVHLCHPDKHNGSTIATRITQWLLSVRDRIAETEATR